MVVAVPNFILLFFWGGGGGKPEIRINFALVFRGSPRRTFIAEPASEVSHSKLNGSNKQNHTSDSLPEWSKGVDSSSTGASCVGSNPIAVMFYFPRLSFGACKPPHGHKAEKVQVPGIEPETVSVLG